MTQESEWATGANNARDIDAHRAHEIIAEARREYHSAAERFQTARDELVNTYRRVGHLVEREPLSGRERAAERRTEFTSRALIGRVDPR